MHTKKSNNDKTIQSFNKRKNLLYVLFAGIGNNLSKRCACFSNKGQNNPWLYIFRRVLTKLIRLLLK
jgi:hypothetical protein